MRGRRSGESALLLLDAIDVLNRGGVSYAVIGAMAASVHGVVRASMDADAVLSLATHALTQMEHQFREAGFRTELRLGDEDDPIAAVLALTDELGNRVDLLVGLRGLEPAAFSRVLEVPFQGERLRIIVSVWPRHRGGAGEGARGAPVAIEARVAEQRSGVAQSLVGFGASP